MLLQRLITAVVLLIALIALLGFASRAVVQIALCVVGAAAVWEWVGLVFKQKLAWVLFAGFAGFAAWFYFVPFNQAVLWALSSLAVLASSYVLLKKPLIGASLAAVPFAAGCVLLAGAITGLWVLFGLHVSVLLSALALVWVADVAAYFVGKAFGKTKLAPTISPGKSWEGVMGGLLGVTLYAGVLMMVQPDVAVFLNLNTESNIAIVLLKVLLCIALAGLSVTGDLMESLAKRQAGVKDSSNLLPGHGGILDRIDALIPTLPLMAALQLSF